MKILLAGPGTGKTTNIKNIIDQKGDGSKFLVLSFTNATVNDLKKKLTTQGISSKNCMTLHKFAIKYNHDKSRHILIEAEKDLMVKISRGTEITFNDLCDFFNATTFDQMIDRFVNFAKSNPHYLKEKLAEFDSLIVDEYQDFNPHEQALIDILIEQIKTSYILGDDDQCIYDFKDASADKIITFYEDDSNEKIHHEHICYRCPDKIVEHATNLIKLNKKRVNKEWNKSGRTGEITYLQLGTLEETAKKVYEIVNKVDEEGILILTPVEFAVRPLIEMLETNNIEFINYFAAGLSQEQIEKSWEVRILFGKYNYLNLALLGYTKLSLRKNYYSLLKKHFDSGKDYEELFQLLKKKLPDRLIDNNLDIEEFLSQDYYSDLLDLYKKAEGTDSDEKIEKIFKEIGEVEDKRIKIMSIHKSKGLGEDHVIIIGLNEGIIPNKKKGNDSIESQRRLFYVGITRAQKQLYLISNIYFPGKNVNTVNKTDFIYDYYRKTYTGKASSFISELNL